MSEWFKGKNGLMMHWGLYALLGGEYRGQKSCHYAEWIQSYSRIPIAEYGNLANIFNPIYFDAEEYVKLCKDCGMDYLVFVSKHHDGFAMFRSKCDPYNIVDATPYKKDVVEQLANACARHGLKFSLYYSQDLDWHEIDGGGYKSDPKWCCGTSWSNNWDFPEESKKDYSRCFEKKIMPQVEEILTQYGELCLIWFDVPMTINTQQSQMIYDAVKRYQPDCLINSRLGNGVYDYVSLGDNEIPKSLDGMQVKTDMNDIGGIKPCPRGLYETAATINDSWGYCAWDRNWKSASKLRENRDHLNSMGINYLLNVGPDALGRIPAESEQILREAFMK